MVELHKVIQVSPPASQDAYCVYSYTAYLNDVLAPWANGIKYFTCEKPMWVFKLIITMAAAQWLLFYDNILYA